MTAAEMHANEVATDVALVRALVRAQFPEWAELPVEAVPERGTDNALYRLGDELVARLPRLDRCAETLRKELRWLPQLAPGLPLAVPLPVAVGEPAEGFPFPWAIYGWLEGDSATPERIGDVSQAAADLAEFIAALQRIDSTGGPGPGAHNAFRGIPLAGRRDEVTRAAIAQLDAEIETDAVTAAWDEALRAADWHRPPVWIHGDLDSRNLLVRDGRLSAVLDFGCLGVGDPACDAMVAWKLLDDEGRATFRSALGIDDATWSRARGWAVSQAVVALAYYTVETNAVLVREAQRWLGEALR